MSEFPAARVVTQLGNAEDLRRLLTRRVDAIHLQAIANADECRQLVHFFETHPRVMNFENGDEKILRLGNSFYNICKAGRVAEEYDKPDILEAALGVNDVLARIIGTLTIAWPHGLETFSHQGCAIHRSIVRRVDGVGYEPHDDDLGASMVGDRIASTIRMQLGLNLYLEIPTEGGELEGWRRRMPQTEYDRLRNPDPRRAYGVRREALGACDWSILPRRGDVVVFSTSEIHAVRKSIGPRTTWGFFLGYRGDDRPLLIWS